MTQNDPTEIARVAAGLTRAQRDWILTGKGYAMAQVATDRKGLTVLVPIGRNKYDRILTRIGHAVRDHILREKSGG